MSTLSNSNDHIKIEEYKFSDLFDMNEIQQLQDLFCSATGVASIITAPDGTPITKASGFCSLCNVIRKTEKGIKNCQLSDSIIGKPSESGPRIQNCLSGGLIDGGASIIVDGVHIASWLIGQVLDEDCNIDDLLSHADVLGIDRDIYKNELLKVTRMSKSKFNDVCNFLFLNAQLLSKYAIKNISLTCEINKSIQNELEIKKANAALDNSNTLLSAILESSPKVMVYALDTNYRYINFNKKYQELMKTLFGKTIEVGMNALSVIEDNENFETVQNDPNIAMSGENLTIIKEYVDNEKSSQYWQNYLSPILSSDNKIIGVTCFAINITEQKNATDALKMNEENLRTTLKSIGDGVITTDKKQNVQMINDVAQSMTGWTQEEAFGKPFLEVFNISHEDPSKTIINPVKEVLEKNKIFELSNNTILTSKDGFQRHIADSAAPIKDVNGNTNGVVMVFRDVTEKSLYLNEIKKLSFYDGLTGLHNRSNFEMELDTLDKSEDLPISVIIGDVNGLKLMNDVYGHAVGDELLIKVASIMKDCTKHIGTPTRWGGDEFTMLLPKISHEEALSLCEQIKQECIKHSKEPLLLSISFGISTKNEMSQNLRTVLIDAEDKMYTHKLVEGRSIRSMIISSLRKTLAERSCETEEHSSRMISHVINLGEKLNLSQLELDEMKLLTLLHDVGKIGIPDEILNKPAKLNEYEWSVMRKHPEIGYRIALSTYELANIAGLILTHHEKWDGSGYPQGLKGKEIPKLSRLLSIIDAYDAMTSDRPYRVALSQEEAIAEIKRCSGHHFDPVLSEAFISTLS